MIYRMLSYTKL